jgi:hypothetical protein
MHRHRSSAHNFAGLGTFAGFGQNGTRTRSRLGLLAPMIHLLETKLELQFFESNSAFNQIHFQSIMGLDMHLVAQRHR